MFNTKRIKALGDRIEDIKEAINKRIDYWQKEHSELKKDVLFIKHYIDENYAIPCHTCKCLIRKEDAIKGKSEVRPKRIINEKLGDCLIGKMFEVEQEETIYTPYYCHNKDCKPKK